MVSLVSSSSLATLDVKPELAHGNLQEAVEPFTQAILRAGNESVRLHCMLPTWCPSSDTCFDDMHDLHDLRSRSLAFIHDLLIALKSSGVHASYSLAPSNSSACLVCASGPDIARYKVTCALDVLQNTKLNKREHVVLPDLTYPSLIIT